MLLSIYKAITKHAAPILEHILNNRLRVGKEDLLRIGERRGNITRDRPIGRLYWLHAASIGEAQSALILIKKLLTHDEHLNILVTTGTLTSAKIMETSLPERAFHQFYPMDHPHWVTKFLDHWQPSLIFWMESELWPNMLEEIRARKTPVVLVNARLSKSSYKKWRLAKTSIETLLSSFTLILCQTTIDHDYFVKLGAQNVKISGNIKHSAKPLTVNKETLLTLKSLIGDRPCWVYASTHDAEEEIAARTHMLLKQSFPDILTIIVPRHPERRDTIKKQLSNYELQTIFRNEDESLLPDGNTDIYVADTLGELGLFYRLSSIAVIGRSFSGDGGGGHNPLEAALLECVVLHGPNVQNLQAIYDEMSDNNACIQVNDEKQLYIQLEHLLEDSDYYATCQGNASAYAQNQSHILDQIMIELETHLMEKNVCS